MNYLFVVFPVHILSMLTLFSLSSGALTRVPDLHDDRDDGHSGFLVVRRL